MSTGLMSCVRENSPPLEMAENESSSGAISLQSGNASVSDQQKRRRFHPLRNLRRIFRRRTLTAVDTITTVQSVSSPSSPSSSQFSSTPTVIASVPAHNLNTLLPYSNKNPSPADVRTMSSAAYPPSHYTNLSGSGGGNGDTNDGINDHNRAFCDRYGGVPVMLPFNTNASASASGGFYNIHDINNGNGGREHICCDRTTVSKETDSGNDDLDDAREITDYQRSFSEGRLIDSDYNREALSQSHDSVFSESATASSLSIVLKAELFDVLRKRRNRPDASDEDLGLPRSPTTPQRKDQTMNNQSEVSSLSLLSIASSDLDDESSSNYGNGIGSSGGGAGGLSANTSSGTGSISGGQIDKQNLSVSSKLSQDTSKTSDELDFSITAGTRLSHSAARHKMAIRPKKKGPTRHRRPIESTVLPTTPEVNEDMLKAPTLEIEDFNMHKTQSLPPGMNSKIIEDHETEITNEMFSSIKKAKIEKLTVLTNASSIKSVAKNSSVDSEYINNSSTSSTLEKKDEGFFRRLLHRNSKKVKKQQDEIDNSIEEATLTSNKQHIEQYTTSAEKLDEYNQKVEETRKEIRKEILSEAKSGLSAMLNNFILSADHEKGIERDRDEEYEREVIPKIHKPKSGPAARQRIMPKDLSIPVPETKDNEKSPITSQENRPENSSQMGHRLRNSPNIQESPVKYFKFSNEAITSVLENIQANHLKIESSKTSENFNQQSVDDANNLRLTKSGTEDSFKSSSEHFEKKERPQAKIVGLSPFQQKISRAEVSVLEHRRPVPKQRKSVEKSKSFRYYSEGSDNKMENNLKKHENMPSLPDLSFSKQKSGDHPKELDFMPLSLSFEINDNNLLNQRHQQDEHQLPLSQGIYTKNIILTTSKPSPIGTKPVINSCNQNITEIEENIDKLVKSPFVTVLKKSSSNNGEDVDNRSNINISTASVRKTEAVMADKVTEKPMMMMTISIPTTTSVENYRISSDMKAVSTENLSKYENRCSKDRVSYLDKFERKSMEKLESTESLITKVELRNKEKKSTSSLNLIKSRRNSSVLEKFENSNHVPEFMKIQLNRVDSARPKSNIVLAKNVKETEEKEIIRRFSNENVEISDSKPPIPSICDNFNGNKRSSIPTTSQRSLDDTTKNSDHNVDEENNILRNSENTQLLYERKKSVTDEKLKYEKKIEELKSEWKKSSSEENDRLSRKIVTDDENGVVLRKKSFAFNNQQSTNKEDTPELMKVFARRSLKIKDDEMQTFEDLEKVSTLKKLSKNLDSDKENQSSSEEKLDKLPKVEITIQQQKLNASSCSKIDDKNRNSSLNDLLRKPNTIITSTTSSTKSYISPIRYSNIVGYRNQTNFNGKTVMASQSQPSSQTSMVNEQNNNNTTICNNNYNNNNNNNNNTNNGISNNINNNNNNNVNNNNNNVMNKRGLRHTIGPSTHSAFTSTTSATTTNSTILDQSESRDVGEFKGILQRRAEWEKRAKEALK